MSVWWNGLTNLQQFLYCIAVPSTVVLLIQTILMFIGLGGHGDIAGSGGPIEGGVGHDIPHDAIVGGHSTVGHGGVIFGAHDTSAQAGHETQAANQSDQTDVVAFRLFTFRGILAFLVVFGWVGIAMAADHATPVALTLVVSFLAGTAALFLTAWMYYAIQKLQCSGNISLANAVGLEAEVYIPIPAARAGQGKVNLLLQGRWVECDAVTLGIEPLKTKQTVKVVNTQGGSVLVVESIKK